MFTRYSKVHCSEAAEPGTPDFSYHVMCIVKYGKLHALHRNVSCLIQGIAVVQMKMAENVHIIARE